MGNLYKKFYVLAIIVILAIAGGLYSQYLSSRALVYENTQKLAGVSGSVLTRQIESWLTTQAQVVEDAAGFIGLNRWRDEDVLAYLKVLNQQNPAFASLYFASVHNEMINASGWQPPVGFDLRKRPWYVMALVQNRLIYTEAFVNASKDATVVTIAKPVHDAAGTLLGVVGGDLSVSTVTQLVIDKKVGENGFSFLVDGNNTLLAHTEYPRGQIGGVALNAEHLRASELAAASPLGAVRTMLRGRDGFLAYQPIEDTTWKLGSFVSLEDFFRNEEQIRSAFWLVLLISIIILFALFALLSRYVIEPLARLNDGVSQIDIDNLSAIRLPVSGGEEFVEVTRTINRLLDKASGHMDDLEDKVDERTRELQAANQDLTAQNIMISSMNEEIALLNQSLGAMNDALESRVAEKTAKLSSALSMQSVLREIAEAAVRATSLDELYRTVHQLVARVLPAKNFYVSLIDVANCQIIRPYCVDETGTIPLQRAIGAGGLTNYVIQHRRAVFVTPEELSRLQQNGEVTVRQMNYNNWAGAPLMDSSGKVFGTITVFSVNEAERPLRSDDLEAFSIIATQVSQAIERRRTTEALRTSEERFRQAMEFSGIGYFEIDLNKRTILLSANWRQRLGMIEQDGILYWDDYLALIHPEDELRRQESLEAYLNGVAMMYEPEYRIRLQDGSWIWLMGRLKAVRNAEGQPLRLVGTMSDITELKQREEKEKYRAEHDELTGVYNRRGLEAIFAESADKPACTALMLIDIREFALINAAHGRGAGDEYLIAFAEFLRDMFSQKATVARSGGAEFILMFDAADGLSEAMHAFETIESVCIQAPNGVFCVHLRCGIADGCQGVGKLDELIRQADMALRQAKEQGNSCCRVFDHSMLKAIDRSYAIREQLNQALERQEFYLEYQPVFDIRQEPAQAVGYEALLRWSSPVLGKVSPAEFIPVVESTNLILPLGQWVLEEACRFSAREKLRSGNFAAVAVNLSVRQLAQVDFVDQVLATLAKVGLPAENLQLEVTESILMTDFEKNSACLASLRDSGIGISLDDFGTGYSSFTYLAKLPISTLKIDKTMTDGIACDRENRNWQLMESLLHMAERLGYDVVVEGVERQTQLQALRTMGFTYCQGYLLGRPAREKGN